MIKKIQNNRLFEAFWKTMLFSAALHLFTLYIPAILNLDYERVNIFKIIDFTVIFPNIAKGIFSFIISYIFIFIVYLFIYLRYTKKRSN